MRKVTPLFYDKIFKKVLEDDPRPSYKKDIEKAYGFPFSDYEIKFIAKENKIIVTDIIEK